RAEDDDLGPLEGRRLVLSLERSVEVRRHGLELRGAGVDHLVGRTDVPVTPTVANALGHLVEQRAHLTIRESKPLGATRERRGELTGRQQLALALDDIEQFPQEELVDT